MDAVPAFMLQRLYVSGSMKNVEDGFEFAVRNNIDTGTLSSVVRMEVDGQAVELDKVLVGKKEANMKASDISYQKPVSLYVGDIFVIRVLGRKLEPGGHKITLTVNTFEAGRLNIPVSDTLP